MRKRVLIAGFVILLLISLHGALAQEDDTILIPIEDATAQPGEEPLPEEPEEVIPDSEIVEPVLIAEPPEEPVQISEIEEIPEEVAEIVEELPEEEQVEVVAEPELISIPPPEFKPSIFSKALDLAKAGFSRVKYVGWWFLTRDYVSFGKNVVSFALGLSIWIKIILVIIALVLLLIFWAYNFRDTRANNLRKARKHHKKGEVAHNKGEEEDAEYHYERAAEHRGKAQEQW